MTIYFKELGNYGRLGNCLFQIAATIGTAHKYGDNYRFPFVSFLEQLNLPKWSRGGPIAPHIPTYEEPHFHYAPIPKLGNLMNLHGYFQSDKYFADCADEIKKALTPSPQLDYSEYTSIHVRREDYLIHTDCYNILSRENYYDKAMAICPSERYMIFSDDLDWCKAHFVGEKFFFSEERDPIRDLANLISCSNHIIANSSFSWWGAWLSPHKNKRVVAPEVWFGSQLAPTHNTKDLYPDGWIKVGGKSWLPG